MDPLIRKASEFAAKAHAGVTRKWTGEPYIEHAGRVAAKLEALGFPAEVVAAGYLHDVIEDCPITAADLAAEFGPVVARLVVEVTKPKKLPGQSKPARNAAVIRFLAGASYAGASIKLADMADNSSNVAEHDPAFAKGYLAEMAKKVAVLGHGHPALLAMVRGNLAKFFNASP